MGRPSSSNDENALLEGLLNLIDYAEERVTNTEKRMGDLAEVIRREMVGVALGPHNWGDNRRKGVCYESDGR